MIWTPEKAQEHAAKQLSNQRFADTPEMRKYMEGLGLRPGSEQYEAKRRQLAQTAAYWQGYFRSRQALGQAYSGKATIPFSSMKGEVGMRNYLGGLGLRPGTLQYEQKKRELGQVNEYWQRYFGDRVTVGQAYSGKVTIPYESMTGEVGMRNYLAGQGLRPGTAAYEQKRQQALQWMKWGQKAFKALWEAKGKRSWAIRSRVWTQWQFPSEKVDSYKEELQDDLHKSYRWRSDAIHADKTLSSVERAHRVRQLQREFEKKYKDKLERREKLKDEYNKKFEKKRKEINAQSDLTQAQKDALISKLKGELLKQYDKQLAETEEAPRAKGAVTPEPEAGGVIFQTRNQDTYKVTPEHRKVKVHTNNEKRSEIQKKVRADLEAYCKRNGLNIAHLSKAREEKAVAHAIVKARKFGTQVLDESGSAFMFDEEKKRIQEIWTHSWVDYKKEVWVGGVYGEIDGDGDLDIDCAIKMRNYSEPGKKHFKYSKEAWDENSTVVPGGFAVGAPIPKFKWGKVWWIPHVHPYCYIIRDGSRQYRESQEIATYDADFKPIWDNLKANEGMWLVLAWGPDDKQGKNKLCYDEHLKKLNVKWYWVSKDARENGHAALGERLVISRS